MNYAIIGPGNGATNNSVKNMALNIVKNTVLKSYFNDEWNNRNRNRNYAIWNENGRFSGFALLKKKGNYLEISLIGARKGQGIGSKLISRIIENAKNNGIKKIKLNSVPNALPFYQKFGFKVKSANDEHILMSLRLKKHTSPSPVKKLPSPIIRRSLRIHQRRSLGRT